MTDSVYLIDNFVNVQPGEPYRLFPFGRVVKNGKVREITRELALQFKLPHFKPPIKLGSHANDQPAGGHIIGLEVRDDGLYAVPELNDVGAKALNDGSYRYHSPEVIWEGGFENPSTGQMIEGPLIVGDALLHMPHLGEAAALYTVQKFAQEHNTGGITMSEMTQVPASFLEKLMDFFTSSTEAAPEPEPITPPEPSEDFAAQLQAKETELETYKAQVVEMEAKEQRGERVAHFAAEVKEHDALKDDAELHGLLADLPEEQAGKLLTKFKALAVQIDESNLTSDVGGSGDNDAEPPADKFSALVLEKVKGGMKHGDAVMSVIAENPDLAEKVK